MGQKLYGRGDLVSAIHEASRRTDQAAGPGTPRPVLVLEGPAGTGKSALLDAVATLLDRNVPYAYLRLSALDEQPESSTIPELLAAIAFELARRCGAYRSLSFPRLVIGHLVMRLDLDDLSREKARSQVAKALRGHRGVDDATIVLQSAAKQALTAVPSLAGLSATVVPDVLIDRWVALFMARASRGRFTGRRLLGPHQQWFGDQDRHLGDDPLDVLVTLNQWASTPAGSPTHRQADRLMSGALLADLRSAFAGMDTHLRAHGPVLLLDNADTELSQRFLQGLVDLRRAAVQAGDVIGDPLTVVAASRGDLLTDLGEAGQSHRPARTPIGADGRTSAHASWWRHPLPNLDLGQVQAMVADLGAPYHSGKTLADSLLQFTGGHPGATRQLLEKIGDDDPALAELRDVLRSQHSGRVLEVVILERLLSGTPTDLVDPLTTWAAARDRADGLRLGVGTGVLDLGRLDLGTVGLWAPDPLTGPTVLRRLLLRRLAQRSDDHPHSWDRLHAWLAEDSRTLSGPGEPALYYQLAGGHLEAVARAMTERLSDSRIAGWLRSVHAITQAPRRGSAVAQAQIAPGEPVITPVWVASELSAATDLHEQPLRAVHQLIASLWVAADPLCGNDRAELYWQIAEQHREILRHGARDRAGEMTSEVRRYENLAQRWQQPVANRTGRRSSQIDLSTPYVSDGQILR